MRKGKTYILAAVLLVAIVAFAGILAACGSDDGATDESASPTAQATSAADIAQQILGKAPSGVAKEIVDRGTVLVSTDANYAPQSSVNKTTGELEGFDIDTALAMGKVLGLGIDFKKVQWETVIPGLQTGKWDVSIGSMTITPEREKTVDFTEPYYYTSGQVFVKKGGEQIKSVDDLAGKTVGVGAATTYYDFLKKNSKAIVKTYDTDASAFPDLRNGNLDFVMTAGPTGQQAILEGQPFDFSGAPLYYEDLGFAINKGEGDWLTMLNYAVDKMHEDGTLTTMSKKWYNGLDLTVKE
jgi:polar amino acid transport system substrate-binding protein